MDPSIRLGDPRWSYFIRNGHAELAEAARGSLRFIESITVEPSMPVEPSNIRDDVLLLTIGDGENMHTSYSFPLTTTGGSMITVRDTSSDVAFTTGITQDEVEEIKREHKAFCDALCDLNTEIAQVDSEEAEQFNRRKEKEEALETARSELVSILKDLTSVQTA